MTIQVYPHRFVRLPSGPQGPAAGQDIGWALSGGFTAGEVIGTPPLARAATFDAIFAHTTSGVQSSQTLTILQKRPDGSSAGITVATTTLNLTPSVYDYMAIADPGLVGEIGDYFQVAMPNPIDNFLVDLNLTLGSTP